jgi:diaminohydroxyphosphoribosylaminopyrimidine deaminase/5-amino-6-(5-phosphoribosylamino)uracil reductase
VRVVLDERLSLSPRSRIAETSVEFPNVAFTLTQTDAQAASALQARGVEVVRLPGGPRDLRAVLAELYAREIQGVLVEGGAGVAGSFFDAGLVDKVSFFVAPIVIGGCDARPAVGGAGVERVIDAARLRDVELTRHGEDFEITGYPEKKEVRG